MRPYPLSKTQVTVLSALNFKATSFNEAEQIFAQLGLVVSSKREGRNTVPVITVLNRNDGGFNAGGDGETFRKYAEIDTTAIKQWIS